MRTEIFLSTLAAASSVFGALNEPCIGSGGRAGVCVTTATCSSNGGVSITGACPGDAADVRCCTKAACSTSGNCRWQSDCGGTSSSGFCPGPAQMKCCSSTATGFGGYSTPSYPAVGACQAVAVNGAKALVAAFPGRVRQLYCTRACTCNSSGSDHCCGKAIDFMCSDGGGVPTMSGQALAEWAMRNAAAQKVKYIIWGQRIWNPSVDAVKTWPSWRVMEDRGSITDNHWDHVHISYN